MIASYHNHTYRCRHAQGTEEAYVQQAIACGMEEFGFSDHTPQLFHDGFYSSIRMYPRELPDYVNTVCRLREEYGSQLRIHLGVEAEYYPACFRDTVQLLRDHGVEYMLLGQHWIGNENGQPYAGSPTADPMLLEAYCSQTIAGLQTGLFTYLAHPDLMPFVGEHYLYRLQMRRICREAKSCGIPLEINLNGLATKRSYPNQRFWELAAEEGNTVVLGADAHCPEMVHPAQAEEKARELVRKFDLQLVESIPLVRI